MKTKLLTLAIISLGLAGSIFGQVNDSLSNKSGLYMSANDFLSGKLTYEINCANEKHKIKTANFLNTKTIKVTHRNSTFKLSKSTIWGFRLCDGKEYRIYQDKEYEILDKGAITVYQINETTQTNGKNNSSVTKTKYYFSENAGSSLKILTLKNIETSFAGNKKFHDLIDLHFKSDGDLFIYDDYYKMLRLNHTYLESLK